MGTDDPLLIYEQILEQLQRCCIERRTGTALIASDDNQLARILFENGNIVSVMIGTKSDKEAIPFIRHIKAARVKFSHGKFGSHAGGLALSTDEVLAALSGKAAAPAGAPANGTIRNEQIAGALKVIHAELIEFLGPMGSLVWNEHLAK